MKERLHQCPLVLAGLAAMAVLSLAQAADSKESLARQHWAYQPIRPPPVPAVHQNTEVRSPIDAFVAAKLEAAGLTFSSPADRRTLLRRAYVDLVGLFPTFEETERFLADNSADAFAKVVERLLASPEYGERWGRHWLDVARYAETKDLVLLFGKDRLQPYAYTYRDYVIRALNLDTPYDRFIVEQIAADQLEPGVEKWRLAALGFLNVGRLFDNNPNDQIDDQIDTVTRGFLGLTVACARCHNHKYDAIPTEDYYSLYGVFANSARPFDLPLIEDPERVPGGLDFERKLAQARRALQDHIDAQYELLTDTARQRVRDYLLRVATSKPDISETATFYLSLSPEDLRPGLVLRWRRYLEDPARRDDPVFGLWTALMEMSDDEFPTGARQVLAAWCGEDTDRSKDLPVNSLVAAAFRNATLGGRADVARTYGDLLECVYEHSQGRCPAPGPAESSQAEGELLSALAGRESPLYFPRNQTPQHMSRVPKDKFGGLVGELDKIAAYATNAPPARAMVVADSAELSDPHVFIRGSPTRPGQAVPRRFLKVLSGDNRPPFPHGSGRLDLAKAITAPDNPLTSRVMVNRVWMHHFGEPLVNSPSDFGMRSELPTNPGLLDYLAWSFMRDGWSLKNLHRQIMLSRTYQQASSDRPECRKIDPENRLLWRAHRRRLDFEVMRDGMLAVAGRLEPKMGGRSVDVAADPLNCRRTVYGLVDRQDLPAVFRAFDFACPDQSVERRPRTIVPQQALFALNSPFVLEQARALTVRAVELAPPTPAGSFAENSVVKSRVESCYRLALGRLPDSGETEEAVRFVRDAAGEGAGPGAAKPLSAWEQLAQVLLISNEFMFVD